MSFGFSVGDFINVGTLAYQIYERCKASVTEFRDLSRDVRSMHIVLKAIEDFWEEQARRGLPLSASHSASLHEQSNDCKDVLHELEKLLDKHGELGAGAGFLSRMKWVPKNIGPLRMRLLARTNSLSAFNNVITASSAMDQHVKSQARILAALNVINYAYHSGKRTAPAFSQAQTEKDLDNKETWKEIVQDLKDEGIDKESLASQEPFIKGWIDEIVLTDEGYVSDQGSLTEDASERASSVGLSSFNEIDQYSRFPGSLPPRPVNGSPRDLSRAQTVPNILMPTSPEIGGRRPRQSHGSIASQDAKWRPEQTHPSQMETLVPLFRLEYGVSRDDVFLRGTVEHLYNKLDLLKRGLLRRQFDSQCLQVIESVEPATRPGIVEIIHSQAKAVCGRFDQMAFSELIFTILEFIQASKDKEAETKDREDRLILEESDRWGESMAYTWLCIENNKCHRGKILPRHYTSEIQTGTRVFRSAAEDIMCHNTATRNLPGTAMSTFAGMALLADFCSTQISHVYDVWSHNDLDRSYLTDYLRVLDDVLEAAASFDDLEDDLYGGALNELDRLYGEAELLDLRDTSNLDLEGCPMNELRKLRHSCYHSLQKIFGFLFDLTTPTVQQDVLERGCLEIGSERGPFLKYLETPPMPTHWRLKMETQAYAILRACSEWHATAEAVIPSCKEWYSNHQSLSQRADEALKCSAKLKKQAKPCMHLAPKRITEPIVDKFVCLRLSSLTDLPRGPRIFGATKTPNIFAKIIVDGEILHRKFSNRDADKVYQWDSDIYHLTVHPRSVIQVRFHNANRNDKYDEGFLGLVHIPVDNLVTTVQGKPQTMNVENSFYRGPDPPAKLSLTVHWCPTAQFLRQPSDLFVGNWARKDTADGRFLFEDLKAEERGPGSRTAIVERRKDGPRPNPTLLKIIKPDLQPPHSPLALRPSRASVA